MPNRPTSRDVARLSGVSQPTVSYVLNDTPGQSISAVTRARVRAAADELGYRPSQAAQTLARRGRSRVVVLNAPPGPRTGAAGAFFTALASRLEAAGWTLLSHFPPADRAVDHLLTLVHSTNADAVLDAYGDPATIRRLRRAHITVVPLVPEDQWRQVVLVPVDIQLRHLVDTGRTTFAIVSPDLVDERSAVDARRAHLRWRCTDLGRAEPAELTWNGDLDALSAELERAVQRGVDGVLAHNDDTAMPVLAAAARIGVKVPTRLAVVGVDDSPIAALTVPPLSSVAVQRREESFETSAERILTELAAPGTGSAARPLEFRLVRRGSS